MKAGIATMTCPEYLPSLFKLQIVNCNVLVPPHKSHIVEVVLETNAHFLGHQSKLVAGSRPMTPWQAIQHNTYIQYLLLCKLPKQLSVYAFVKNLMLAQMVMLAL